MSDHHGQQDGQHEAPSTGGYGDEREADALTGGHDEEAGAAENVPEPQDADAPEQPHGA